MVDGDAHHNQFEWSKAVETGHEQIDSEHIKLFELLSGLNKSIEAGAAADVNAVAGELRQYSVTHFENEEALMAMARYEHLASHQAEHRKFIEKVDELQREGALGGASAHSCVEFIYDWLFSHICSLDRDAVDKMHGAEDEFGSRWSRQTTFIINSALQIAADMSRQTLALERCYDEDQRSYMIWEISDMSNRIVNLVTLVVTREDFGQCTRSELQQIKNLKQAVAQSAGNLMRQSAQNIIYYGARIIDGRYGVPLGVGALVRQWLGEIEALSNVVGRSSSISDDDIDQVISAYDVANRILVIEKSKIKISSFDKFKYESKPSYEVPKFILALRTGESN